MSVSFALSSTFIRMYEGKVCRNVRAHGLINLNILCTCSFPIVRLSTWSSAKTGSWNRTKFPNTSENIEQSGCSVKVKSPDLHLTETLLSEPYRSWAETSAHLNDLKRCSIKLKAANPSFCCWEVLKAARSWSGLQKWLCTFVHLMFELNHFGTR